jgi:hypothetical protein
LFGARLLSERVGLIEQPASGEQDVRSERSGFISRNARVISSLASATLSVNSRAWARLFHSSPIGVEIDDGSSRAAGRG